jgi:hypothetical protein
LVDAALSWLLTNPAWPREKNCIQQIDRRGETDSWPQYSLQVTPRIIEFEGRRREFPRNACRQSVEGKYRIANSI